MAEKQRGGCGSARRTPGPTLTRDKFKTLKSTNASSTTSRSPEVRRRSFLRCRQLVKSLYFPRQTPRDAAPSASLLLMPPTGSTLPVKDNSSVIAIFSDGLSHASDNSAVATSRPPKAVLRRRAVRNMYMQFIPVQLSIKATADVVQGGRCFLPSHYQLARRRQLRRALVPAS